MGTIIAALKSRAIWGVIIMVASRFLNLPEGSQDATLDEIMNIVPDALGVSGAILAIIGRWKAKGPIEAKTEPK